MSDIQALIGADAVWFAANSGREPSEPQPVVRLPAARGDGAAAVRATYIEVPQVPQRHALILSRPVWCWGGEMGVNERGVAIACAAVVSRGADDGRALLGMDLVRLGLERGATAEEAVAVIKALLAQHGQGGPTGFRQRPGRSETRFVVADAREAWVLETSGRDVEARRIEERHEAVADEFMPWLSRARERRALALHHLHRALQPSFARLAFHLRAHGHDREDPNGGSNADVCLHAAGFVRRRQTTGSMIVRLAPAGATAVFTGTSAPCLSIFRPADFGGDFSVLTPADKGVEALLWRRHELLHRRALADPHLRERLRATRDPIEARIFEQLAAPRPDAEAYARADRLAAAWHKVLWESLPQQPTQRGTRFWRRLSQTDGLIS